METYTQEQVNELKNQWMEQELKPLQAQVAELSKYKPKEPTDEEKALAQKENELWQREIRVELSEAGFSEWFDFLHVEKGDTKTLKTRIESLKTLTNKLKAGNSYVPDSHKAQDKYSKAESAKDPLAMISAKLDQLFK